MCFINKNKNKNKNKNNYILIKKLEIPQLLIIYRIQILIQIKINNLQRFKRIIKNEFRKRN